VSVNYHLLADFRANNGELLERLMIDSVAVLLLYAAGIAGLIAVSNS